MKRRHATWRVFLPAITLLSLALVPPLAALSLWLCGIIRDDAELAFEVWWRFRVTMPCAFLGVLALLGGLFAFFFPVSKPD